jgi:A/G-specific adenine glycosylase
MELWFTEGIQHWYRKHKRDLPWRHEKDPYKIWISEIILQQTQVAQGLDYYHRFLVKFPTIQSLAAAKEDEVMKAWQGLGYYSRARHLHASAKEIDTVYGGRFPKTYEQIRGLKGIGDYTAAAIASFAYNMPYAVLDGNVYRLLSRLFGIITPINDHKAKHEFAALAQSLLDKKKPGIHNQAIMEFGSQYCKTGIPGCAQCIFSSRCLAFKNRMVERLPVKLKKTKVKIRHFYFFVLIDGAKQVRIEKRESKDIWQGLYQFPLMEFDRGMQAAEVLKLARAQALLSKTDKVMHVSESFKHLLSHQTLFAHFVVIRLQKKHARHQQTIAFKKLTSIAFPRLIEKFLNSISLAEINYI